MADDRYFDDFPLTPIPGLIENEKVFDIRDDKWAHPILRELDAPWFSPGLCASATLYNPAVPMEEKHQLRGQIVASVAEAFSGSVTGSACDVTEYEVPGCPEEPDTPVKVLVYRPKALADKKRARVMFYCMGGALVITSPLLFPIDMLASRYNCVLVVPVYRNSLDAPYPAAINDLHAAYKWMVENSDELRINAKKVVIHGFSSGAHLSLAIGFRLKRYGYKPAGIVAINPQTDDRERGGVTENIFNGIWDGICQHDGLMQWLGCNFASGRIGPEALANHATVEDCIGYPPTFIHTTEFDPDRDNCREFVGKLMEAKTFVEFHVWGGAHHAAPVYDDVCNAGVANKYSERTRVIFDGNIEDCFEYDLRRPWVLDE